MIKNRDSLKAKISKLAAKTNISNKYIIQTFMFEALLKRISVSEYKDKFIIKGGLLLSSIFGVNLRSTMDLDTTIKGLPLNMQTIENVFNKIISIDLADNVKLKIENIKDIRLEDEYGGFRLNILSTLDNNKTYITVELTTGDVITPKEMKYNYNSIFEDKKIPIMSYTLETVLAEKFQTIVTRGLLNTRLKDFYDVYILINTKINELSKDNLIKAIKNTFERRETNIDMEQFNEVIKYLNDDKNMNNLWNEYVSKNPYAKGVKFEDTIKAIKEIVEILESELVGV